MAAGLGLDLSERELVRELWSLALLWARCAPSFLLVPWLVFQARSVLLAGALSLACAIALWPLAYAAGTPMIAPSGPLLLSELLRGSVIALGCAAPFLVLTMAGAIADGLRGPAAVGGSVLGRGLGFLGLTAAVSAAFLSGVARLMLEAPQPTAAVSWDGLRGLLRELGQLLFGAIDLAVSFSAPIWLGLLLAALSLALITRANGSSSARVAAPVLLPYLGLALVCLTAATWLDAVPDLVARFARETGHYLRAWP
jgi:type III secretory pathway component EscT